MEKRNPQFDPIDFVLGAIKQLTCGLIRENLLTEMNPEIAIKMEMVVYVFSLGICGVCC